MTIFTTAQLNWFDDGCCDVRYLDLWDKAPLNFHSDQQIDHNWHRDHHEKIIGHDPTGHLFQVASEHLLNYHFYPPALMISTSDFSLNHRQAKVGDKIVQRIHLLKFFGYPILDVIGMTEVTQIVREPRQTVFAYTTVSKHVEQGQWCAGVEWMANDQVLLSVNAISRPNPQEPRRNYGYMRAFQKQANQQGIAHFSQLVNTAVAEPA